MWAGDLCACWPCVSDLRTRTRTTNYCRSIACTNSSRGPPAQPHSPPGQAPDSDCAACAVRTLPMPRLMDRPWLLAMLEQFEVDYAAAASVLRVRRHGTYLGTGRHELAFIVVVVAVVSAFCDARAELSPASQCKQSMIVASGKLLPCRRAGQGRAPGELSTGWGRSGASALLRCAPICKVLASPARRPFPFPDPGDRAGPPDCAIAARAGRRWTHAHTGRDYAVHVRAPHACAHARSGLSWRERHVRTVGQSAGARLGRRRITLAEGILS